MCNSLDRAQMAAQKRIIIMPKLQPEANPRLPSFNQSINHHAAVTLRESPDLPIDDGDRVAEGERAAEGDRA